MRSRSRPPTLEHVAQVAGVSRATVSRVVNGVHSVDPELRRVVERAIADIGYVPNRAARSLVTRRADTIALVVSEPEPPAGDRPFASAVLTDPFFGRVLAGMLPHLREQGAHPLLVHVDSAASRDALRDRLRQHDIGGVALVSIHPDDPLPALLAEAAVPTVTWARPARPGSVSYVDVAHDRGARLAADHLVARGCRRVATIAGPAWTPAGADRLAGFRAAMAANGQPEVPSVEGAFTLETGERAMETLLAEHPEVDGVFAANDLMAQGALLVLREHGRRVPEDVAVIGFDDSSAALACRPPLTTVRQPVEDMAGEMVRLLLAHIEDPRRAATSVVFEPSLVPRRSA
jgi:DNA-binding LacI/PurR family transcriptional regulator